MKTYVPTLCIFLLSIGLMVALSSSSDAQGKAKSVYDFTMKDIDGKEVKLNDYKGKVLLIVNVASKCGLTPQYKQLVSVYERYKDKGLVVIGFPANNFANQEPGTNSEIKSFCTTKYGVTFPMFSKISVKGADQDPLFKYLTSAGNSDFTGNIGWNFEKFLVGKDGTLIRRFKSLEVPDDEKIKKAIEEALRL